MKCHIIIIIIMFVQLTRWRCLEHAANVDKYCHRVDEWQVLEAGLEGIALYVMANLGRISKSLLRNIAIHMSRTARKM